MPRARRLVALILNLLVLHLALASRPMACGADGAPGHDRGTALERAGGVDAPRHVSHHAPRHGSHETVAAAAEAPAPHGGHDGGHDGGQCDPSCLPTSCTTTTHCGGPAAIARAPHDGALALARGSLAAGALALVSRVDAPEPPPPRG